MLRKIFKFEVKQMVTPFGILILIYGISLLLHLVLNLLPVEDDLKKIFVSSTLVIGFAVIGVPVILILLRFYTTTATREAYTTFSIPAKPIWIVLGKYFASLFWVVISYVVVLAVFWAHGQMESSTFTLITKQTFESIVDAVKEYPTTTFLTFLSVIVQTLFWFALCFLAIAMGQFASKHRVLMSFGMYYALKTGKNALDLILGMILTHLVHFDRELSTFTSGMFFPHPLTFGMTNTDHSPVVMVLYGIQILFQLALTVLCLYVSGRIFTKKLNLL